MPSEIADSDAESDIDAPINSAIAVPEVRVPESSELNVDFDDFLQSQRQPSQFGLSPSAKYRGTPCKSYTAPTINVVEPTCRAGVTCDPGMNRSKTATADHEFGVAPPLCSWAHGVGIKRRHTETFSNEVVLQEDRQTVERNRKKGSKTHAQSNGERSNCTRLSDAAFLEQDDETISLGNATMDRSGYDQGSLSCTTSSDKIQGHFGMDPSVAADASGSADDQQPPPRSRNRRRRVISLLTESGTATGTGSGTDVSMARSSIGGYESINIDYRFSTDGMDSNTNPFGISSQTSVDDEVDEVQRRKIATIFGPRSRDNAASWSRGASTESINRADSAILGGAGQVAERDTFAESQGIHPRLLLNELPHDIQPYSSSTSSTHKWAQTDRASSATYLVDDTTAEDRPPPRSTSPRVGAIDPVPRKKRGRKPQTQQIPTSPSGPGKAGLAEQETKATTVLLPDEHHTPPPTDSELVTNEISVDVATKNGQSATRKKKQGEQSSPMKQPTSELDLSDDALVGLPKETYNPRPSRSRSKRLTETGEEISGDTGGLLRSHAEEYGASNPSHDIMTPAKEPKKKMKKTKVKRAKTTAAALLKKSSQMLSEGEDDVVWLERKPSAVRLEVPKDVSPMKMVHPKGGDFGNHTDGVHDNRTQNGDCEEIETRMAGQDSRAEPVAEKALGAIPPLPINDQEEVTREQAAFVDSTRKMIVGGSNAEPPTVDVEPKKRGRKRQQTSEPVVHPDADIVAVEDSVRVIMEGGSETRCMRPALAEKDDNLPCPSTPCRTRVEGETTTDTAGPPKVNGSSSFEAPPAATPAKDPVVEPEKGPTKHSPINPAGGKIIYRVGLSRRAAIPPLLRIVRK